LIGQWNEALDTLLPELWPLFAGKLDAALKERGVKPGARLVWLPTGALGLLPLGAAQDPVSKRRFADESEIRCPPTLEGVTTAQAQIAKGGPATLAAIINPTGNLIGAEGTGRLVNSYFARKARTLLTDEAASPEAVLRALKGRSHWHFASHGTFNWEDVRQSG